MNNLRTLFSLFVALSGFSTQAQDEPTSYLFSRDGQTVVGGFGGMMVYFGEFNGDFAVMTGGGGAAIFNRSFFIGGYGIGLATRHEIMQPILPAQENEQYKIGYGHGGLWAGFISEPSKLAHFTGSLKLGGGYLYYSKEEEEPMEYDIEGRAFFVMTPEVGVEVNVFPYMKIAGTIGYQYVPGSGENPVGNDRINTFMGGITFKFGWFGDQ